MEDLILLVEDDPNDEELARLALELSQVPHTLRVARDGPEALEWLLARDESGKPDGGISPRLILLDLKLPKMTGLQVLERIRKNERTHLLPVVIFTSSIEARDLDASYRLGANAYLRKPVDFQEYKRLIAEAGNFWVRHNQTPLHGRIGPGG